MILFCNNHKKEEKMGREIQQPIQEEKKSRWWIWLVIVISIFILIGILAWLYFGVFKGGEETIELKQITFGSVIENCQNIESKGFLKNSCIKTACNSIGTEEEKIQKCMEIKDSSFRDYCLFSIIPRTLGSCNKISNLNNRDECLSYIEPITMEVCDSIRDSNYSHNTPKSRCYIQLAKENIDDSICDKINDDVGNRVECYMNVGILNKDPEICEKIDFDYLKDWCLKPENSQANLCTYGLKRYEEKDWLDFSIYDKYKDHCIGAATEDASKCGDKETGEKRACLIDIAKSKNDLSMCDIAGSGEYEPSYKEFKMNCYMELADLRNDSSLCDEEIIGEKYKDLCYLSATEKIDISLCEKISGIAQVMCYTQLAEEKGDFSLCNRISYKGTWLSSCHHSFVESLAEGLNENFNEEDQILFDKCCKSPYDCEEINKIEEVRGDPRCGDKKGEYELRVYDSQGRVTGSVNGEVKLEIPRSFYFGDHSIETEFGLMVYPAEIILFESNDTYIHEIFGLTDGNYNFQRSRSKAPEVSEAQSITLSSKIIYTEEGKEVGFKAEKIPISPNVTHQYHFDWDALAEGKEGTTILIDNDNDGVFEKKIIVGTNITCEEFISLTEEDL